MTKEKKSDISAFHKFIETISVPYELRYRMWTITVIDNTSDSMSGKYSHTAFWMTPLSAANVAKTVHKRH